MTPIHVTGQVLSRDPAAGTVHIWLLGLVDEAEEFTIPAPPGLPDWAVTNYVFGACLDSDVRTIAQLAARPSALHNFRPGNLSLWIPGAFPPEHPRSVAITGYSDGHPFVAFAQYEAGKWRAAMPGWMEIEAPQWWAELPDSKR